MAQKHVQTLLLLLACIAYAQVPDFNIYRDGSSTPLIESPPGTVDTTIYYGTDYVFSVKMKDGSEGYEWCWNYANAPGCTPGQSFVVRASDNVSSTLRIRVSAKKNSEEREKWLNLRVIPTYTVSFNSSLGGNNPGTQTIWGNNKATKPVDPKKNGYNFLYWYEEGNDWPFDFEYTTITRNIALVAKWKEIRYSLTFYLNDPNTPWDIRYYSLEERIVTLPTPPYNCTREFKGWVDPELGTPITNFIPGQNYYGDKTFNAKWGEEKKQTPNEDLFSYYPPPMNGYEYGPEAPLDWASQKQDKNGCEVGNITIQYMDKNNNRTEQPPKEVGEYTVFVHFEENDNYEARVFELPEKIIINKFNSFRNPPTYTYTIKDKEFDGNNKAEVKDLEFHDVPTICLPKETLDYTINATFRRIYVEETDIPVDVTLTWKIDGPAYKNCNLSRITDGNESTAARINKATNVKFEIIVPEYYRLSSPGTFKPRIVTEPFVDERGVVFEYRKVGESEFTADLPDVYGQRWEIKATLEGTNNYEPPAPAFSTFLVVRGSDKPIEHGITIEGFKGESQFYFSENCKIDSDIIQDAVIQIEVLEADIIFKKYEDGILKAPDPYCSTDSYCEEECIDEEKCYMRYNIPITFAKQGLDTLTYSLSCKDGSCDETLSLLIETALPFEDIVQQRWNNTLFVNNNPRTNGGYSFTDFTWFQNDVKIDSLQFYSAGPKSTDLLKTSDTYRVQMHYLKDNDTLKISTCNGHSKPISITGNNAALFKKQVLGIGGKKASVSAKVYNSKGCKVSGNAPGVYLVEEK